MKFYPIFLSVVYVLRNQSEFIRDIANQATEVLSNIVTDYELIIVDNASDDETISLLKVLTGDAGYPNLQVYSLTKQVDNDTAAWVGLENALGDFVAVIDPMEDDIRFIHEMLDSAVKGADVVFADNESKKQQGFFIVAQILHSISCINYSMESILQKKRRNIEF